MNNKRVKAKSTKKPVKRLISYITAGYKLKFLAVVFCILVSAIANVSGSMFIGTVIDDYITPMLSQSNPEFAGLLRAIIMMALL